MPIYGEKNFKKAAKYVQQQFKKEYAGKLKNAESRLSFTYSYMSVPHHFNRQKQKKLKEEIIAEKLILDLGITELVCLFRAYKGFDQHIAFKGDNTFLQLAIVQISNSVLAISKLLMSGLENSARVLVRSLIENIAILMIIILDADFQRKYIGANADHQRFWAQNFAKGKIWKKLDGLLKDKLNYSSSELIVPFFKDAFNLYSPNIHSSALSTLLFSVEQTIRQDQDATDFKWGLFGAASPSVIETTHMTILALVTLSAFHMQLFRTLIPMEFPNEDKEFNEYFFQGFMFRRIGGSYLEAFIKNSQAKISFSENTK